MKKEGLYWLVRKAPLILSVIALNLMKSVIIGE